MGTLALYAISLRPKLGSCEGPKFLPESGKITKGFFVKKSVFPEIYWLATNNLLIENWQGNVGQWYRVVFSTKKKLIQSKTFELRRVAF